MMFSAMVNVLVPIYALVGLGVLLACVRRDLETKDISFLVLTVFAPALVVHAFRSSPLTLGELGSVFWATLGTVLFCYVVVFAVEFLLWGRRDRDWEISVVFVNSGYMGLPFIFMLFGEGMMPVALAFSISMTLLHFTLGVLMLRGGGFKEGIKELVKMPLLWAMPFGFLTRGVHVPQGLEKMLKMTGEATLPIMLVVIGIGLSRVGWGDVKKALLGTLLRYIVPALGMWLFGSLLLEHVSWRLALVYQSSLPSAVMNYVLCDRYGSSPQVAASVILFSTLLYPLWFFTIYILIGVS